MENLKHSDITGAIIKSFYKVYNSLGYGFLEKVYENALVLELKNAELVVSQQHSIHVNYKNAIVGEYAADILVNHQVILELKAVSALMPEHQAQCMNYLKATKLSVCLLINFGKPKVEIKRIINHF